MRSIMDGNTACARIAYLFSELCTIYPITPSSPMASKVEAMNYKENYNLFHDKVKVVEMQSEAGAAGAMHGALLTGSLATTFTASQGLLLMIPNMYKIAGERLPGVIHVAARTVATHALSIFGDHSDIYAARPTGFCMLASTNTTDAQNLAAVAHLASIEGRLPFLHFFDGFRTSHEVNTIELLKEEDLLALVNQEKLQEFKKEMLLGDKKIQKGLAENEDIYFQSLEARNMDYLAIPDLVNAYMQKINDLTGCNYKPFNYYGAKDAKNIIIAMGSVCDTVKLVVNNEIKKGEKIGLIEVHLYRPFSKDYLLKVLPETVEKIAVLDRTKEPGSEGEPLYLDVVAALKNKNIQVVGGRYGISSKNTTPEDIYSVFKMLDSHLQENFTIGIIDDVTHLSLPKEKYEINLPSQEVKIYGFGSDGMVSASKDILKLLGTQKDKFVQGYFEYDSKKSGGVTISHIRFGNEKIEAPFYVTHPKIIVVTKEEYFRKFKLLEGLEKKGILLISSSHDKELSEKISKEDQDYIRENNISVYVIDAEKLALEHHLKGKINKIMEVVLLNLLGIEDAVSLLKTSAQETFKTKGQDIVENNIRVIELASTYLKKLELNEEKTKEIEPIKNIYEKIDRREGYTLTTNDLLEVRDGSFPANLSQNENRKIANIVPKWISENCIQCGQCAIVCPHAVIRPILTKKKEGIPLLGNNEYNYEIVVSENDCTSCGLCINICPGKLGKKALQFEDFDEHAGLIAKEKFATMENPQIMDKYTIKGCALTTPKFAFSGACAGCGETPYIKILSGLLGDELVIANATGCSSIYGGYAPSTPYNVPWANSLFEDNAEFAFGMHLSIQNKRNRIEAIMKEAYPSVTEEVQKEFDTFLKEKNNYEITKEISEHLKNMEIPKELRENLNYVPAKMVWAIGGDGWAYDIGFGGLDHILASNENIKILVLDTEVYSNTGGQMSKSSHIGQVAEFADYGKRVAKKDLFRIAMSYPNCYVASISLGANLYQTIKTFKEAKEHVGPSLIIAYSPCVEHGIKGGLSNSINEEKLAVEVGYTTLMRYNPETSILHIDSKEPDFSRYHELLDNEVRYHALKIKDASLAEILLKANQEEAQKRYLYYKNLSEKKAE